MRKNKNNLLKELTTGVNRSINDLAEILLTNNADILDLKEEIENIKNILEENIKY